MQRSRLAHITLAAALALAPVSAFAATPAEVHPGMQVVDPSGGIVGTVISVNAPNLVVKTGKHEVTLALDSFTANKGKLLFAMTAAQLDAATEQATAAAAAAVAVGAQVYGSDGTLAGQIESLDDKLVTIKLANGSTVSVPRAAVAGSAKGALVSVPTAKLVEAATPASGGAASDGK